jgi:hypothetical protein
MIFASEYAAQMSNELFYGGSEPIKPVVAVEFNGSIFPTNPLIVVSEEQHGNP